MGDESQQALNSGLFQAIRPGEIIRHFGIQLRSIEFAITDPNLPGWVWLNHKTVLGAEAERNKVIESSIFAILKKEPNIRNLDAMHSLVHKILEGRERRKFYSDELSRTVLDMVKEVVIEEKPDAIKFITGKKENLLTERSIQEASFNPFLLINFDLRFQNRKLSWDTIEVYAKHKLKREELSTSSFPWSIDSSNRIQSTIQDLFRKRINGNVLLTKAAFIFEPNIYFSIADVDPDNLKARIVVFKSSEEGKGEYNFVDIRRRLDLFLHQTPTKFGFKIVLPKMSANDTQLVIDKLEA